MKTKKRTSGVANGAIQLALWTRTLELLNEGQLRDLRDWLSSVIASDLEGVTGDREVDRIPVQFLEDCLKAAEERRALIQDRLNHLRSLQ